MADTSSMGFAERGAIRGEVSEETRGAELDISDKAQGCGSYWQLNPLFVEWLMGYPIHWGDTNDKMATKKSGTESVYESREMRMVRGEGSPSEASPGHNETDRDNCVVQKLPPESRPTERHQTKESETEVRGVRGMVRTAGQPPTQDLRCRLSGDSRTRKCVQAVAWEAEPDVGRLAAGVPHRVDRLKGLGNAIVPQIAELLFRQIKRVEKDTR